MADENMPLKGWDNPFLRNMPMVAIVRQKGVKNGESVVSDEIRSKRVLFRVGNNVTVPEISTDVELMPGEPGVDQVAGFDSLMPAQFVAVVTTPNQVVFNGSNVLFDGVPVVSGRS